MQNKIKAFLKALKINKINIELALIALSHPSYTKEKGLDKKFSYERLEFLGDSVLKLASSKLLYEKFPEYDEGILTKIRSYLVSDASLAEFSYTIKLDEVILLSSGEEKDNGRNKKMILACAFESLLGAIFLTYGFEFCEKYLNKIYKEKVGEIVKNLDALNPKANLQELLQGNGQPLPEYKIVKEVGPPHNKIFECEVLVNGNALACASAPTKKEAEALAAKEAFCILEKEFKNEQ